VCVCGVRSIFASMDTGMCVTRYPLQKICMFVSMPTHKHTCIYEYMYMHMYMYVYMYIHMYMYMYMYMHMYMYMYVYM